MRTSHSFGGFGTNESWTEFRPLTKGTLRKGILVCRGRGTAGDDWITSTHPETDWGKGIWAIIKALTGAGFHVIAGHNAGPATWGNDTATTQIKAMADYLSGTLGSRGVPFGCLGVSMGNAAAWNLQRRFPTYVGAIAGILPASDLDNIHANATYTAEVNTAYGGNYLTNGANTHNPVDFPNRGIPYKAWYAGSDTVVTPTSVTTLATNQGGTAVNLGAALTHVGTTIQQVPPADVASFFTTNLA